MISDLNATVIVFYDPRKYKLAEKLLKHFEKQAGANRVVLVEDRPVSMIAGLMSFCRCLVTRNTDLFQLAVALRIPTVALLKDHEIIQWSPEPNDWLSHVKRPDESWPTPRSITKTARELVSS
jgi:ADP-heptose:LPS heptosyltransferase